jgi:hypothetical protein
MMDNVNNNENNNENKNNNNEPDKGWMFKLPKDWKSKSSFELMLQAHMEFKNNKLKLNKKLIKKLKLNMSAIKLPFDWKKKSVHELELQMNSKKMTEPPVVVMLVEPKIMVMYAGEVEYVEYVEEIIDVEDPLAI